MGLVVSVTRTAITRKRVNIVLLYTFPLPALTLLSSFMDDVVS
jgi:hypothetical protein